MADSRGRGRSEGGSLGPVVVRYYRKMRLQRVYGVVVSWPSKRDRRAPSGTPPVKLRLLMAGAQVVPAEQLLNPNDSDAQATFYVTPLAKGGLRNEKLEILVGDRKVQEVLLPARVTSQRFTKRLLFLAILLPVLLLTFCKYLPASVTDEELQPFQEKRSQSKRKLDEAALRLEEADTDKKPALIKARNEVEKEYLANEKKIHDLEANPGKVLELRIANEMPDMPEVVQTNVPDVKTYLIKFREMIGEGYSELCHMEQSQPMGFYVFGLFVGLAFISYIFHWDRRKKRWSKAIVVPRSSDGGVSSRRAEPVGADADYD